MQHKGCFAVGSGLNFQLIERIDLGTAVGAGIFGELSGGWREGWDRRVGVDLAVFMLTGELTRLTPPICLAGAVGLPRAGSFAASGVPSSFLRLRKERSMSRAQKTPILVPAEERPFVSIPRRESVYCEDCDTVSVRIGAACGVCRSYYVVEATTRGLVLQGVAQ